MKENLKNIKILITGGTGLVGKNLCEKLISKGYQVGILSRTKLTIDNIKSYTWNLASTQIEAEAIETTDFIIHLAGENIGEKRWTKKRKQQIIDSRVKAAELLFDKIKLLNNKPKAFISASAIGYYGAITTDKIFEESDNPATDFLGETCQQWENAVDKISALKIRTVKIRTGVVLSKYGGILHKLEPLINIGLASALGSGKQYMPWIHMDDLCDIYIKAIADDSLIGAYNAVSTEHITNKNFTKTYAKIKNRPFWFRSVPAFVLKFIFGEMANMMLKGSRISNKKITDAGYQFKFNTLEDAMKNILIKM